MATLPRPHREAFQSFDPIGALFFFLQCCDEKPPLAMPAVKLDLKSDTDLKSHKGSRTKLSTHTVSERESNALVLQQKKAVRLMVESYRPKVLKSCSD